jgi:hypothetical protein
MGRKSVVEGRVGKYKKFHFLWIFFKQFNILYNFFFFFLAHKEAILLPRQNKIQRTYPEPEGARDRDILYNFKVKYCTLFVISR